MAEQNINDANARLIESIKKFASSYTTLSAPGKAAFEAQVKAQTKKMDERTKKLYEALIDATKNEYSIEKTIQHMQRADNQARRGI